MYDLVPPPLQYTLRQGGSALMLAKLSSDSEHELAALFVIVGGEAHARASSGFAFCVAHLHGDRFDGRIC